MRVKIELTREDLQRLVAQEIARRVGDMEIGIKDVRIETRSKQNYKSEWETADFRATYEVTK